MIRNQLIFPIIREICSEENIKFMEEPSRGMFGVLIFHNNKKFFIKDVNLNLNYTSSVRIAKNKALTSYFLEMFGYCIPKYTMVYSAQKCERYKLTDNIDAGLKFANNTGYPVILKINDSSKGRGIYKVYNEQELLEVSNKLFQIVNTFQIQKYYSYNDYRVVVLGDKILSAYQRIPLYVVGDGKSTIKQLLTVKQELFTTSGRDTIIDLTDTDLQDNIRKLGYNFESILENGKKCALRYISNLSAGGECVELTNSIHTDFAKLCVQIAKDLNLNLVGIDIMCNDICRSLDDYIILEVNSSPGLDNYAYSGEKQELYVKELYRKVILYIRDEMTCESGLVER